MIHLYPTRADWLEAREDRVGASEVYYLINHPATFLQRRAVPLEDNDDLRRGRIMEPAVGALYAAQTGNPATPGGEYYGSPGALVVETHPDYPWAAWSPDFLSGERGSVETKTQRSRREWADDDVTVNALVDLAEGMAPAHMVVQAYWQLACNGRDWNDLVALLPNYDLRIVRFHADPVFQTELLERAADARERYLIRGELPPIDGSKACAALLARRFPVEGKTVRAATRAEVALLDRFATAAAEAEAAKTRASVLRNQVLSCIGADYGIQGGGRRAVAPAMQRESFRLSEVPDDVRRLLEERGLIGQGKESRQVRLT